MHTVRITDSIATTDISIGLAVKHRMFQGFSVNPTLTETEIEALTGINALGTVGSLFAGARSYSVPATSVPLFVYWAYPADGSAGTIKSATIGLLTFPLTILPGVVTLNNAHGLGVDYKVVRSSVGFGSGVLIINIVD